MESGTRGVPVIEAAVQKIVDGDFAEPGKRNLNVTIAVSSEKAEPHKHKGP